MYEIDVTPYTTRSFQANQRGNSAQTSESAMAKNVTDPNETPEAIQATYKLIVAVDIGTTYTKVAWCPTVTLPAEPIVHVFADGQWKDQVPTAVLYRPSQHRHRSLEFDSFGHEAICKFREEEQGWALFQRFKIDLHRRMVSTLSFYADSYMGKLYIHSWSFQTVFIIPYIYV